MCSTTSASASPGCGCTHPRRCIRAMLTLPLLPPPAPPLTLLPPPLPASLSIPTARHHHGAAGVAAAPLLSFLFLPPPPSALHNPMPPPSLPFPLPLVLPPSYSSHPFVSSQLRGCPNRLAASGSLRVKRQRLVVTCQMPPPVAAEAAALLAVAILEHQQVYQQQHQASPRVVRYDEYEGVVQWCTNGRSVVVHC